jgi:putative transposase
MSEWWNKNISSQFPLPSILDVELFSNLNFGLFKHDNIYTKHFYFYDLVFNNLLFNKLSTIDKGIETDKININIDKQINNINISKKYDDKTKQIKIKTLITKKNKAIQNIDATTKTIKFRIYPDNNQIKVLDKWFNECIKVYDFCIKQYNKDKKYFNNMNRSDKIKIFNDLYSNNEKDAPYDMLTDEVRIFFSNLKSCISNLKNGHIKHFELKSKDVSKSQSVFLPKTSIKKEGIYISHLGIMKGMDNIKKIDLKYINDSRLLIDKTNKKNEYYLCITYNEKNKETTNRIRVCSLDPGESVFNTCFSEIGYSHLGIKMRNKILPIEQKIRRYQRILSNKQNDYKIINGKRLRDYKLEKIKEKYTKKGKEFTKKDIRTNSILVNKSNIKNKIRKCYKKIKNIVKELHNKTALYLVKNYERILLPKFETQNMLRNKKFNKDYFNKLAIEKGEEECKKEIRKVYKNRRLNGRVKFVLNNLSHYKFKMHLLNKCKEYGSELIEVTEEYTSKTCTNCGAQSAFYSKNRTKQCSCGYRIDRDINGARNIMIKNIEKVARPWVTILPKEC